MPAGLWVANRCRRYPGAMPHSDLAHLELLAEVDALVDRLNRWADDAPAWRPAEKCRALVRRLVGAGRRAAGADRGPAGRGHPGRHRHRQERAA